MFSRIEFIYIVSKTRTGLTNLCEKAVLLYPISNVKMVARLYDWSLCSFGKTSGFRLYIRQPPPILRSYVYDYFLYYLPQDLNSQDNIFNEY